MQLKMDRVLLPDATIAQAKPLVGFDKGEHLYHVVLFDLGDAGGAIGVLRDGDPFCARITLDALAEFHTAAKAERDQWGEC